MASPQGRWGWISNWIQCEDRHFQGWFKPSVEIYRGGWKGQKHPFLNTKGAKCWYFRFSWADKQPRISLGTYSEMSLRDARALRDVARALVSRGIDPRVHRQLERNARRLAAENA